MVQVMHLDSSLLRGFLDSEDKKERRAEAMHLKNTASGVKFRASILAVGEVFGKMVQNRDSVTCAEAAAELNRLVVGGRIDLYGVGKGIEVVELATELMTSDYALTPADAILLACAFTDAGCRVFATADQRVVKNVHIQAQASSRKVRILDVRRPVHKKGSSQVGRPAPMILRSIPTRSDPDVEKETG